MSCQTNPRQNHHEPKTQRAPHCRLCDFAARDADSQDSPTHSSRPFVGPPASYVATIAGSPPPDETPLPACKNRDFRTTTSTSASCCLSPYHLRDDGARSQVRSMSPPELALVPLAPERAPPPLFSALQVSGDSLISPEQAAGCRATRRWQTTCHPALDHSG